jgi:pyrroline-5-carboxylate reductase
MIKVGFIGYGSMGSMLVNKFIEYGALKPGEIIISTRTRSKLDELKTRWTDITIADSNNEAAENAKYIFICVKPLEVKDILNEIRHVLTQDANIIYLAGSVRISSVEEDGFGKVTKIIPSLTSEAAAGVTLVCHGAGVAADEAEYIDSLFNKISAVKRVREDELELSTELTSCMPGFIASIFKEMSDSAGRFTDTLSRSDIDDMIIETLYGTVKLLRENHMSFQEVVGRVATKGGITEEGVKVFESQLPSVFDEMFRVTLEKRKAVNKKAEDIFAGQT